MTDTEICKMYRTSKYPNKMIPILIDLTGKNRTEILLILIKHGEKVSAHQIAGLYKRRDALETKIHDMQKEYREIAQVLEDRNEKEVL